MGFFSSCLPVPEISGDWIHKDLFSSVFLDCKWQLSSLLLLELFCALMVLFPSLKSTNFTSAEHGGNETERQQYLSHLILRARICLIQFSLTKQTEKTEPLARHEGKMLQQSKFDLDIQPTFRTSCSS